MRGAWRIFGNRFRAMCEPLLAWLFSPPFPSRPFPCPDCAAGRRSHPDSFAFAGDGPDHGGLCVFVGSHGVCFLAVDVVEDGLGAFAVHGYRQEVSAQPDGPVAGVAVSCDAEWRFHRGFSS